jgi:predicted nucleic acid-binding protein
MPAYWDSSAAARLCISAQSDPALWKQFRRDPIVTWWGTELEIFRAIQRLARESALTLVARQLAEAKLTALSRQWSLIAPTEPVRVTAQACLRQYNLRTADALQLASALIWCRHAPRGRLFVCRDTRLSQAAGAAGFEAI